MNTWRMMMLAAMVCAVWVNAAGAAEHPKITAMKERLAATASAYDRVERELELKRQDRVRMLEELGPDAMDPDGLVETLRGLDDRLFEAELALHLLEVRRETILQHLAEHQEKVRDELKGDEVAKLHQTILERLRNQVAALEIQFKDGRTSQADLLAKRNELDRVRIEIAAYERQQAQRMGGEVMAELNRELMRASVDRAVQKALIEQLEQRLAKKRKTLHRTMEKRADLREANEQMLRQNLQDLREKMETMRMELREAELYFGSKKGHAEPDAKGSSSSQNPGDHTVFFTVYERVVQDSGVGPVGPGSVSLSL